MDISGVPKLDLMNCSDYQVCLLRTIVNIFLYEAFVQFYKEGTFGYFLYSPKPRMFLFYAQSV